MIKISPSLLSADFAKLGEEAAMIEKAGADMLHLDVMDGQYVPNLSFGAPVVEAVNRHTNLPLDVHIMAVEPSWMVPLMKDGGADIITLQVEAVNHIQRALVQIRSLGMKAGIALNPGTPVSALEWLLPDVDLVLIMSVNPGYGGQKLIPQVIDKVAAVRRMLTQAGSDAILQVDGGVGPQTIKALYDAGADAFVAGTSVFKAADPKAAMEEMRRICEG